MTLGICLIIGGTAAVVTGIILIRDTILEHRENIKDYKEWLDSKSLKTHTIELK